MLEITPDSEDCEWARLGWIRAWKYAMSSEACPGSESVSWFRSVFLVQKASIQEVSLSVPLYPVKWTRYSSFQACRQLSILESRISEILNSRFVVDNDWQGRGLNMIRDQVWGCWFQHGYVENWVYSVETVGKS